MFEDPPERVIVTLTVKVLTALTVPETADMAAVQVTVAAPATAVAAAPNADEIAAVAFTPAVRVIEMT